MAAIIMTPKEIAEKIEQAKFYERKAKEIRRNAEKATEENKKRLWEEEGKEFLKLKDGCPTKTEPKILFAVGQVIENILDRALLEKDVESIRLFLEGQEARGRFFTMAMPVDTSQKNDSDSTKQDVDSADTNTEASD